MAQLYHKRHPRTYEVFVDGQLCWSLVNMDMFVYMRKKRGEEVRFRLKGYYGWSNEPKETSQQQAKLSAQLSFSTLNRCSIDVKNVYGNTEKSILKSIALTSRQSFNKTCIHTYNSQATILRHISLYFYI